MNDRLNAERGKDKVQNAICYAVDGDQVSFFTFRSAHLLFFFLRKGILFCLLLQQLAQSRFGLLADCGKKGFFPWKTMRVLRIKSCQKMLGMYGPG